MPRIPCQDFFSVPEELRPAFWQDTLYKNRLSLLVICIMIFGMELFNMARVLLWSSSGLGTLNNRIYFGLYLSLWLSAALYLVLSFLLRRRSAQIQWRVQYGAVLFFLVWHTCLNAYDLSRDPQAETVTFLTAVLALAVFIQMPALYSLFSYALAYGLFMALAGSVLSSGTRINLTFTSIVALAVSLTHCRHTVTVLSQRQEIDQMNQQLLLLLQKDPLTGLLNQAAFQQYGQELLAARAAALYIMDLDNFKRVNDRYGHPCGDYVLQQTAKALQAAFPSGAAIGRIGGDEFAVLLSAPFGAAGPEAPALRLLREMAGITWQEHPLEVSCSVGICLTSRPGVPYDQVYRLADDALYQVKRTGKGRTHLSTL